MALIVGELGSNVLRHGGGGEILLRTLCADDAFGLEILALDRGPGMTDIAQCMHDGYSTGGTLGTGMGVVRCLAHEFDVYSLPGAGTATVARVWRDHRIARNRDGIARGVVRLGDPGTQPDLECDVMVDWTDGQAEVSKFRHLGERIVSRGPALLQAAPSARAILVLHTAGLPSDWTLASCPGLLARHPSLVAGVLYRDFAPPGHPVTIVAVAHEPRPSASVLHFETPPSTRAADFLKTTSEAS